MQAGHTPMAAKSSAMAAHWSDDVFREMQARDIKTVCTIPDGGLTLLLQKVEADPGSPAHILTVRGLGYKFEA